MKKREQKPKRPSSRGNLAENLVMARTLWGWSQEELGHMSGLKRTYIGALERQEINPGVDNIDKLAAAIGVSADLLIAAPEQAYARLYRVRNGD